MLRRQNGGDQQEPKAERTNTPLPVGGAVNSSTESNSFSASIQANFVAMVAEFHEAKCFGAVEWGRQTAARAIQRYAFDLSSFGRPLLTNPDLVESVDSGRRLKRYTSAIYDGME